MMDQDGIIVEPDKNEAPKTNGLLKDLFKLALIIVVLMAGFMLFKIQVDHPVEAAKVEQVKILTKVRLFTVTESDYPVKIATQGLVEPVTQTMLVSEVGGQLQWVSPKLKPGESFDAGEGFLKISAESYQAKLSEVMAQVADAKLFLDQEEARAEQSLRDWQKLGKGGQPDKLVTREPQLASARARLIAAEAALVKAQKELEMTAPRIPYAARVEEAYIDRGSYLAAGGQIAKIYAADKVQLRLPLSLEDYAHLPEPLEGNKVEVRARIGGKEYVWDGKLVRTEGKIDRKTMTMMTVVEISKDPEDKSRFALPPVGLFVDGRLTGNVLQRVVRLERSAIRGQNKVWVCTAKNKLEIRNVEILRSEKGYVVIGKGLKVNERVVVSPIEIPVNGMSLEPLKAVETK